MKNLRNCEKELQQIQSINIENSHDAITVVNQVTNFIMKVSSLPDEVKESKMQVKKYKTYVIEAAKQYQETISKTNIGPLALISALKFFNCWRIY